MPNKKPTRPLKKLAMWVSLLFLGFGLLSYILAQEIHARELNTTSRSSNAIATTGNVSVTTSQIAVLPSPTATANRPASAIVSKNWLKPLTATQPTPAISSTASNSLQNLISAILGTEAKDLTQRPKGNSIDINNFEANLISSIFSFTNKTTTTVAPTVTLTTPTSALSAAITATTPATTTIATTPTSPYNSIPKGWPVNGPITSPFGYRDSIAAEVAAAQSGETSANAGKGGDGTVISGTVASNTVATPMPLATTQNSPATATKASSATPTLSPTITTITTQTSPARTAIITPTPTSGGSTLTAASATVSVTATTPSPTIAVTPTPTITPTSTVTSTTPSKTVTPTATPKTPTPTPTPAQEFHTGIDIGVPTGTSVKATADGIVQLAGSDGGYGLAVVINHQNGYTTIYGHNSQLLVKPGQIVHRGDIIALSGSTGYSTGPHVHYEIRYNNVPIDPAPFMVNWATPPEK